MSQFKLGAALSYAGVAFNAIAGLLYTPWMISCIGADDYALYTLAISVVNFFLLDLGLSDAVSRFLSKYYAEGQEDKIPGFLAIVYKCYLVISALIAAVLFIVYLNIDTLYANLGADQLSTFKMLFSVVALYSVVSFPFAPTNGILVSNECYVALNGCNLASKVLTVALIVVALLCGGDVLSLVMVNAFVNVGFSLVKYLCVRKLTGARADMGHWSLAEAKEIAGFSGWVLVAQLCQRFIFAIMPSILAVTSETWEVTLFGLASSLESYVYTVAYALSGIVMPKVTRAVFASQEALQRLVTKFARIQLLLVGFIYACFLALGGRFVDCWMGPEYSALWICTVLLITPHVIEMPQLTAGTALMAHNDVRPRALVYLVMAVMNVVLGYLLSTMWGAAGACLAICLAYLTRTFGLNVLYKTLLGLRLGRYFRETYAKWILPALMTLAVSLAVNVIMPIDGWLGFVLCGGLAVLVYAVGCWLLMLNDYEKTLFRNLFRRK